MSNYTKQQIAQKIAAYEIAIPMLTDIRKTVEAFKHYKSVDKRFTDALKKLDYNAYITKENGFTKLKVYKDSLGIHYEFNVDFSVHLYNESLIWQNIEDTLDLCDKRYPQYLADYKKKLVNYDTDLARLKVLYEEMKDLNEEIGFSLSDPMRTISRIIDMAEHNIQY